MADHEPPRAELLLELMCEELMCLRIKRKAEFWHNSAHESAKATRPDEREVGDAEEKIAFSFDHALIECEERTDRLRVAVGLPSSDDLVALAKAKKGTRSQKR